MREIVGVVPVTLRSPARRRAGYPRVGAPLRAALAVLAVGGLAGACGSHAGQALPKGTPSALQPTSGDAADALVSAWVSRDRSVGLTVATVGAVDTLYALTAPVDLVLRECISTSIPVVCTYGPPGRATPTDPILALDIVKTSKGWYVRSVDVDR